MISKMKTEELKRQMDTVQAPRYFFGDKPYDIRDYREIGVFLGNLGIKEITLQTDNRRKKEALEESGIEVLRKPTDTLVYYPHPCDNHIIAKHRTGDYFSS